MSELTLDPFALVIFDWKLSFWNSYIFLGYILLMPCFLSSSLTLPFPSQASDLPIMETVIPEPRVSALCGWQKRAQKNGNHISQPMLKATTWSIHIWVSHVQYVDLTLPIPRALRCSICILTKWVLISPTPFQSFCCPLIICLMPWWMKKSSTEHPWWAHSFNSDAPSKVSAFVNYPHHGFILDTDYLR